MASDKKLHKKGFLQMPFFFIIKHILFLVIYMSKMFFRIAILFFLFLPIANLSSQDSVSNSENTTVDLSASESEIVFADNIGEVKNNQDDSGTFSTIWTFVKMVIMLAIVVACIYGVFFLFKKGSNVGKSSDPFLRKVSQVNLSPGKSVQVVTLLDNAYIIGVTDNSINLIGQVDDKELINSMNLYADKNDKVSKPRTFADVLDIFMPNGPRSGNVFGNDAENFADRLKRQRENFNKNGMGKGE